MSPLVDRLSTISYYLLQKYNLHKVIGNVPNFYFPEVLMIFFHLRARGTHFSKHPVFRGAPPNVPFDFFEYFYQFSKKLLILITHHAKLIYVYPDYNFNRLRPISIFLASP